MLSGCHEQSLADCMEMYAQILLEFSLNCHQGIIKYRYILNSIYLFNLSKAGYCSMFYVLLQYFTFNSMPFLCN